MSNPTLAAKLVTLGAGASQMTGFYDNGFNNTTWNDVAIAPGNMPMYVQQVRAGVVQPVSAPSVSLSIILAVLSADHTTVKMVLATYAAQSGTINYPPCAADWSAPAGQALIVEPGDVVAVQILTPSIPNLIYGSCVHS